MPAILIVCTANVCRSPVVEALLRAYLKESDQSTWRVASAGTWASPGQPAAPFSVQILAERGIDIASHRSRLVDEAEIARSDLVLCMERGHQEALQTEFPGHAARIYLLSEMAGHRYNIPDPYGGAWRDYNHMVEQVDALIRTGLARIIQLARSNATQTQ